MGYLSADDLTAYGLTASAAQVNAASAILDAYLSRPEGVLWAPDANGAPCYMPGLTATLSATLTAPMAAGENVVATLKGWVTPDMVGEVLIADRVNGASTEALVITAVAGQAVTFATVVQPHATGAILEAGLLIKEDRALPNRRPIATLSRPPAVRILSAQGRYGFGRRSRQALGYGVEYSYGAGNGQSGDLSFLASLSEFGPAQWITVDPQDINLSGTTGEVWFPTGFSPFTEVRVSYVAGFQTAPVAIKAACAALLETTIAMSDLSGGMKAIQAGGTKLERFAATNLSDDVQRSLEPYKARVFG